MSNYIQSLSPQMSLGIFAGGMALTCYGNRKWNKAEGFEEKMVAAGYTVLGASVAAVGVLSAISEISQCIFPSQGNPSVRKVVRHYPARDLPTVSRSQGVQACHAVFQAGIQPNEMKIASAEASYLGSYLPPMQEGMHYTEAEGGVDQWGYLYCWARLSELGKALIGSDSLSIHTANIPGAAYAKINMR